MSRPQVVIFDLDGTLVDSAPTIGGVLNCIRAESNLPPLPVSDYRAWISRGASALVGAALGLREPAKPELVAEFRRRYAAIDTAVDTLYPGVKNSLEILARAKMVMGICSNKPHALCEKVLIETGIRHFFTAVSGGDSVERNKPHPMHIQHTLASMDCARQPFFLVGDSLVDAQATAAANGIFLWASYGYADSDELVRLGQRVQSANDIAHAILTKGSL